MKKHNHLLNEYTIDQLINFAKQATDQNDFEQSIYWYQAALNRLMPHSSLSIEEICNLPEGNPRCIADIMVNLGIMNIRLHDLESATFFLNDALQIRKLIFPEDQAELSSIYLNLGMLYLDQKKFLIAIQMNKQAMDIAVKVGDKSREAQALNNKGVIELALRASYNNIKNNDEISDFEQAYKLKKSNPNVSAQSLNASFANLLNAYAGKGQMESIFMLLQERDIGIIELADILTQQYNLSKSKISSENFELIMTIINQLRLMHSNLGEEHVDNLYAQDIDINYNLPNHSNSKNIIIPQGYSDVADDGFCFYHAVLSQLRERNSYSAEELQHLAINHILENQDIYQPLLNQIGFSVNNSFNISSDIQLQVFFNEQLRHYDGKRNPWADELMLSALANALNIEIEVRMFNVEGIPQIHQRGEHQGEHVVMLFSPQGVLDHQRVVIGNIANVHFVTPSDNQATLAEEIFEAEAAYVEPINEVLSPLDAVIDYTFLQNNIPGSDSPHSGPQAFFASW